MSVPVRTSRHNRTAVGLFWREVIQPRYHLLLGWGLICTLSIALSVFVGTRMETAEIDQVIRQDRSDARIALQTFQRSLDAAIALHGLIQERLLWENLADTKNASAHYISKLSEEHIAGIVQIGVIDKDGWYRWGSATDSVATDLSDRQHFLIHARDGSRRVEISNPLIGRVSGKWSLQITQALHSISGEFAGVAVVSVDPTLLSAELLLQMSDKNADVSIRRLQDGTVLAKNHDIVTAFFEGGLPEVPLLTAVKPYSEGPLEYEFMGKRMISYYQTVDNLGFFVVVTRQRDVELGLLTYAENVWWVILAVILLGLLMCGEMALRLHWIRIRLQFQANRDPLTGLFNRRYLDAAIVCSVKNANRSDKCFSIIIADLDHFKKLNDSVGHAAGDQMLCAAASCVTKIVRSSDVVCRYGGEEILILLPDCPLSIAIDCAESIRKEIEALCQRSATAPHRMTASFGVASFPEHGGTPEAVIEEADRALYQAKNDGRNKVSSAQHGVHNMACPVM